MVGGYYQSGNLGMSDYEKPVGLNFTTFTAPNGSTMASFYCGVRKLGTALLAKGGWLPDGAQHAMPPLDCALFLVDKKEERATKQVKKARALREELLKGRIEFDGADATDLL